jgi:hypothetical protein
MISFLVSCIFVYLYHSNAESGDIVNNYEKVADEMRLSSSNFSQLYMHTLEGSIAMYKERKWENYSKGYDILVGKSWLNKHSFGDVFFFMNSVSNTICR